MVAGTAEAQQGSLRIRADVWCPYNCEPTAERPGFMIEITQRVLAGQGVTLDYQSMPWARALVEAAAGGIDGVVGASLTDARTLVPSSRPLGRSETVLIVRKGEGFGYAGADSLGARRLGVIVDYSYGKEIDAWLEKHKADRNLVQPTSGDDALPTNLRKLLGKRIDVVVEDRAVVERVARAMNLADAIEIVDTGNLDDLFVAISPKHPRAAELAKLLGDGVENLRRSGELAAIMARYGMRDWER
jgi:polar amino acid transport system substrate-binding protein